MRVLEKEALGFPSKPQGHAGAALQGQTRWIISMVGRKTQQTEIKQVSHHAPLSSHVLQERTLKSLKIYVNFLYTEPFKCPPFINEVPFSLIFF